MHHFRLRPFSELLQLIYPALCCHCEQPLVGDEQHLCTACLAQIPWTHNAPIADNDVETRFIGRVPCQSAASLLFFHQSAVSQSIVHQIKYFGNIRLARQFGRLMGSELLASKRFDTVDYLVPVPLHPRRKRQRGYNQSELLCKAMSEVLGKPVITNNLVRRRYTTTQTHKNRQDRMDNMKEVFAVRRPAQFADKHILLVDDIITTGATIENCYRALMHIPGLRISIASLAATTA